MRANLLLPSLIRTFKVSKTYRIMKFFIDTANLEQIRKAHELGVLDGVTTNPSLMAKENIRGTENCNRHYVEICNIVEGDVSAEVIATDFEGMVREGEVLAALERPMCHRSWDVSTTSPKTAWHW